MSAVLDTQPQRLITLLRLASVSAIILALYLGYYAISQASPPPRPFWSGTLIVAVHAAPAMLVLAIVDRAPSGGKWFPRSVYLAGALLLLLLLAGYLTWNVIPMSREPVWLRVLTLFTTGGMAWLLLLESGWHRSEHRRSIGMLVVSAIVVAALAIGVHNAHEAGLYPVHLFIQGVGFPLASALVIAAVAFWPRPDRSAASGRLLLVATVVLTVFYTADIGWWHWKAAPGLPVEFFVGLLARFVATILVAFVVVFCWQPRVALSMAFVIGFAIVASSVMVLRNTSPSAEIEFFLISVLQPLTLCLLAVAVSIAFESSERDKYVIVRG